MNNVCGLCKKTVEVFQVVQYETLVGMCSPECDQKNKDLIKARQEANMKNPAYTDFSLAESHVPRRR